MSIITTQEVKYKSIVQRGYPTDTIERFKDVIESSYLREVFGDDFKLTLETAANDWTAVTEWQPAGNYALNALVYWKGLVKKSKVGTNNVEPQILETANWGTAPKFTVTAFNDLWSKYLVQIISNKIIIASAIPDTVRFDAKGMVISTEDNSNVTVADKQAVSMALKAVQDYIDIAQSEMIEYMKREHKKYQADSGTGYNYSTVKFIGEAIDSPSIQNRKIMMRY